jgi:hypothetical protein
LHSVRRANFRLRSFDAGAFANGKYFWGHADLPEAIRVASLFRSIHRAKPIAAEKRL